MFRNMLFVTFSNKIANEGEKPMNVACLSRIGVAIFCILMLGRPTFAQDGIADFYRGKSFIVVIGATPGGGYDTYARVIARFLGKHIPGNPAIVAQNMPGASSNVAAAWIYNAAPKDGLSMAAIISQPTVFKRTACWPRVRPVTMSFTVHRLMDIPSSNFSAISR